MLCYTPLLYVLHILGDYLEFLAENMNANLACNLLVDKGYFVLVGFFVQYFSYNTEYTLSICIGMWQ